MNDTLLGLFVIIGFILFMCLLVCTLGIGRIFVTNLFTLNHIPYTWANIRHEGGKGIMWLGILILILIVANLIGTTIKM